MRDVETNPFDALEPIARRAALARRNRAVYRLYLRSDAWRATRAAALKAAGFECERCGRSFLVVLDVHHVTYRRLGAEAPEDLLVLCRRCHDDEHA